MAGGFLTTAPPGKSLLVMLGGQSTVHCLLEKALKSLPKDKTLLETVLMSLPPTWENVFCPKSDLNCSVGLIKKSSVYFQSDLIKDNMLCL